MRLLGVNRTHIVMIKYFVPVLSQAGRRHGGWSPLSLNERLAAPFNLDTLFQIIAVTAHPIHNTRYRVWFLKASTCS